MRRCYLCQFSTATLLLLSLLSSTHSARAAGTKWAVLVGIDKYRSKNIASLQFSVADVKAVSEDLMQYGGFPANHVFTMTRDVQDDDDTD